MADYATVLAEVKKLSEEDQQKLLKAIKKPRAAKAQVEDGAEKPKRVLTDEQKAKMKAGREAAAAERARKNAEAAGGAAGGEPVKKAKKAKAQVEDGAEKPKRVMTDEQKAKMKAGREAAKARKAAEAAAAAAAGGVPALGPAPGGGLDFEEPEEEVQLVDWEHDFGTGAETYKRLDYDGMTYVYHNTSKEYLGAYIEKTNKLKKSVPNPLA